MTNLEFIEEQIKKEQSMIKTYEEYFKTDKTEFDKQITRGYIQIHQRNISILQQIKTDLEAWEVVKPNIVEENKIKKQGENVYDLIENGDLITEKRIWCGEEVYVIANVCSKEDKLIHCFHSTLFEDNVYAIYKPDEKGNYIKVWEVKENVD